MTPSLVIVTLTHPLSFNCYLPLSWLMCKSFIYPVTSYIVSAPQKM